MGQKFKLNFAVSLGEDDPDSERKVLTNPLLTAMFPVLLPLKGGKGPFFGEIPPENRENPGEIGKVPKKKDKKDKKKRKRKDKSKSGNPPV